MSGMKEKKKVQTENQERIKTPFSEMVRKFKKQKNAVVALCFIIFLIFLAFFGSKIVPYGINEYDYNAILQGPSMKHLFGTDEFGRDLFSRIICGTRISLAVGFGAVTVGAVCGTILGLLAGYYGGWIDSIIMRICDVLFAFPGLILAIAIVAILGSGMTNVVIAVAVFSTPTFARLVRSKTLTLKNSVFVLAARNIGVSDARILFHHILPGAIPLHHQDGQCLHHLVGGEPVLAPGTLPPAADAEAILRMPGIDDLTFLISTERALHSAILPHRVFMENIIPDGRKCVKPEF